MNTTARLRTSYRLEMLRHYFCSGDLRVRLCVDTQRNYDDREDSKKAKTNLIQQGDYSLGIGVNTSALQMITENRQTITAK